MHQATGIKGIKRATRLEQNSLEGYGILELRTEFAHKKGQPANTVMKSTSLHLKTLNDHTGTLTDMRERH